MAFQAIAFQINAYQQQGDGEPVLIPFWSRTFRLFRRSRMLFVGARRG